MWPGSTKLPPRLAASTNKLCYVTQFLNVRNSGLGLSGSGSSWSQLVGKSSRHLRLGWGWRFHLWVHTRGFWQEASVPYHWVCSWCYSRLPGEQVTQERERETECLRQMPWYLLCPHLTGTSNHFCHILLITQTSPGTWQERTTGLNTRQPTGAPGQCPNFSEPPFLHQ